MISKSGIHFFYVGNMFYKCLNDCRLRNKIKMEKSFEMMFLAWWRCCPL